MKKEFYTDLPDDLIYFEKADLLEVENRAAGIEEQELLDYYGLEIKDIADTEDYKWFKKSFKRGRSASIQKTMDRFFNSMGGSKGHEPAIAYMSRFAGDGWPMDAADSGASEGKFVFQVMQKGK